MSIRRHGDWIIWVLGGVSIREKTKVTVFVIRDLQLLNVLSFSLSPSQLSSLVTFLSSANFTAFKTQKLPQVEVTQNSPACVRAGFPVWSFGTGSRPDPQIPRAFTSIIISCCRRKTPAQQVTTWTYRLCKFPGTCDTCTMKKGRTATFYIVFNYIKIKCLLPLTVHNCGEWVAMTGTLRYSRCPATAVMQLSLPHLAWSLPVLAFAPPCRLAVRHQPTSTSNLHHVGIYILRVFSALLNSSLFLVRENLVYNSTALWEATVQRNFKISVQVDSNSIVGERLAISFGSRCTYCIGV